METVVKKLYEAMFLIDSADAASDWDGVIKAVGNVLERADAEIVSVRKWEECRLAYEINGKSRGTYILSYFRADGLRIRDIERDVQLSERIMRVLILSAEHMRQEDIEKDTPAVRAEKREQEATVEPTVEDKPEQADEPAKEKAEVEQVSAGESEEFDTSEQSAAAEDEPEEPETKDNSEQVDEQSPEEVENSG